MDATGTVPCILAQSHSLSPVEIASERAIIERRRLTMKQKFVLIPAHDYNKRRRLELEGYFPAEYSGGMVKMRLDFPNGLNPDGII